MKRIETKDGDIRFVKQSTGSMLVSICEVVKCDCGKGKKYNHTRMYVKPNKLLAALKNEIDGN